MADKKPRALKKDGQPYKRRSEPRMPTEEDLDRHTKTALQKAGVLPQHRGSNMSLDGNPDIKREEVRQIMSEILYWYNRTCVKTDEECAERLDEFFRRVNETGEIPTVEKMCLALGTVMSVVRRWETGELGFYRSAMIKKAKQILAAIDANLAASGKIPQVVYIFRSKNFYDMSDKVETLIDTSGLNDRTDLDTIRKRYALPAEPAESDE